MTEKQVLAADEADRLIDLAERWIGEMLMEFNTSELRKYKQTTNHALNVLHTARSHLSPMIQLKHAWVESDLLPGKEQCSRCFAIRRLDGPNRPCKGEMPKIVPREEDRGEVVEISPNDPRVLEAKADFRKREGYSAITKKQDDEVEK